jgi:hypothetical protein
MTINIPKHSLPALLEVPGSAAIRAFLVICSEAQDGIARISARDIGAQAQLSERSVFDALVQLEACRCIMRGSRGPGPFSNEIRVLDQATQDELPADKLPAPVDAVPAASLCSQHDEEVLQPEQPNVPMLLASCFRPLSDAEVRRTEQFISEHCDGDVGRFAGAAAAVNKDGGVAVECPLEFYLCFIAKKI